MWNSMWVFRWMEETGLLYNSFLSEFTAERFPCVTERHGHHMDRWLGGRLHSRPSERGVLAIRRTYDDWYTDVSNDAYIQGVSMAGPPWFCRSVDGPPQRPGHYNFLPLSLRCGPTQDKPKSATQGVDAVSTVVPGPVNISIRDIGSNIWMQAGVKWLNEKERYLFNVSLAPPKFEAQPEKHKEVDIGLFYLVRQQGRREITLLRKA